MRSFFSEHTAEFFLVPHLKSIVCERFDIVAPVYFWKTREGNMLSREIHNESTVRVLAMFPRRPKLNTITSKYIHGKINSTLFDFAIAAFSQGIPTIAGLPLARSLVELYNNSIPIWINLNNKNPKDITFKVSIDAVPTQVIPTQDESLEIIEKNKILDLVENKSKPMIWSEMLDVISELRASIHHHRLFFAGGYKPVYFLIFDHIYTSQLDFYNR